MTLMPTCQSAVILAGGQSTRMGFDKQMLEKGGVRLTRHLIAALGSRFSDIMVASPTPALYAGEDVRVIQDVYGGIGPIAGIHAALVQAECETVFVTACDMPYLDLPYLDYMLSQMKTGEYDACVTQKGNYVETLHAFYNKSALPVLLGEIAKERYSVQGLIKKINALIIPEKRARLFLPNWRAFLNLNTVQEYEEFLQRREDEQ